MATSRNADGRDVHDIKKFITTEDEHTKELFDRAGMICFTKSGNKYYYSYDEKKLTMVNFKEIKYECTDILTF